MCIFYLVFSRQIILRLQKKLFKMSIKPIKYEHILTYFYHLINRTETPLPCLDTIIKAQQSLTGCHLFEQPQLIGWLNLRNIEYWLLSILSGCCLTLPEGEDLDQVIVGSGRFRHRQLFEKAYRVGNLIGRWVQYSTVQYSGGEIRNCDIGTMLLC